MGSVEINGASLECFEGGTGEALVLVHGSASDYRTWEAQRAEFSKRFRVIAYSRRYHWPNDQIPEGADYSMKEHVDDLETILHSLDAAPAHLVGHSYGAFLCLLLAIRNPQLVRTLVLAEPPVVTLFVSNRPKPWEILKLLASRPRTALSIIKFGATGINPATAAAERGDMEDATRIFGKAVLGAEAYRRLSDSRLEQIRANRIRAEFLGSGFSPLDAERVRSVRAPTLLLTGERSPRLFHRLVDRLGELLPHSERTEIPGASHAMHADNASAFNAEVLSFLAKYQGGY
jgi:pimeloyl-ACP methyl ester carboxylesterase